MDKDNRILVSAIIVGVVVIVVGAFSDGVTGKTSLNIKETSIAVSPNIASPGDIIYVTVIPGNEGVNEKVSFYKAEDNLRKDSVNRLCNSYRCPEESSFAYAIPTSWESGVYHVKVYDYGIKDFVIEDFTVRG